MPSISRTKRRQTSADLKSDLRIGVDLGGTKIEAIALDNAGNAPLRRRRPTPAGDYRGTIAAVVSLVTELEAELGRKGTVGLGTPGSLSPTTGLIRNANSICLNNRPLDRDLSEALDRPVRLANDADCFALSEAVDGAGAGAKSVFGVILGTGVGGGLVVNRQLLAGPNAIVGEWGHNPLPWPDDRERRMSLCYCGRQGCVETFLCGPALEREFYDATKTRLTVPEIVAEAENGEIIAEMTLRRYEERLARSLALVINIIDPDVIVLGGGLSKIVRLYTNVNTFLRQHVFSDSLLTQLKPPVHGDSSGVRGAAWLWPI